MEFGYGCEQPAGLPGRWVDRNTRVQVEEQLSEPQLGSVPTLPLPLAGFDRELALPGLGCKVSGCSPVWGWGCEAGACQCSRWSRVFAQAVPGGWSEAETGLQGGGLAVS